MGYIYVLGGDVLVIEGEVIKVDKVATEKRSKEIEELTKDMWD